MPWIKRDKMTGVTSTVSVDNMKARMRRVPYMPSMERIVKIGMLNPNKFVTYDGYMEYAYAPTQSIKIGDEEFTVLDNWDPLLQGGFATSIFQNPVTRTGFLGYAVIRKWHNICNMFLDAEIEFEAAPGKVVQHKIWLMKETGNSASFI